MNPRIRGILTLAEATLAAAVAAAMIAAKAQIPGDHEDAHEDNTFGLPDGDPIRTKLRRFFRQQQKQVAGTIATIGHPLDSPLPRMSLWNQPMSDTMTPILGVYYDRAGQSIRGRIGLDPDGWRVTDPHVHQAIKDQAFKFCSKTNATTDLGIAQARDVIRDQFTRGLLTEGQAIPELAKRVRSVFTRASKSRATMIARTEASRAVHAASILSASSSGVVTRKHWLLSANACPLCVAIGSAYPQGIALEGEFGRSGHDPDYSVIRYPPLHPHCRCSMTLEVDEEPPHHDPEKEKEKEKEKSEDRERAARERPSSSGGGGGGGGSRLPKPATVLNRVGQVVRSGRRVAAFVAVPGTVVAVTQRETIRKAVERVRRRTQTGGGMQPVNPPPGPIIHKVAAAAGTSALIAAGPIEDRIKKYMAGAGAAKLARLAALDDDYQDRLKALDKKRTDALKNLDKLRKSKGYTANETLAAEAAITDLVAEREVLVDSTKRNRDRVADALAVGFGDTTLILTRMVTPGRSMPLESRQAEKWLGQVLAKDPANPKGLKIEYGAIPKAQQGRAFYSPKDRRIHCDDKTPSPVIVHEMAHAIEHQWPMIGTRSAEFLDYRVKGEPIKKLMSLFPGVGYGHLEKGRKDKFDQAFDDAPSEAWYVGKEYRTHANRPETRYGTEILSMGIEKLMMDPVKFAKKDPEFCAYVLGILDGSLR